MASVDQKWFKHQLLEKGISMRGMARKMGLDHSALSLTFSGRRGMKFHEAAQIASLLGVGVSQVLAHAGLRVDAPKTVPVVGYIDGHGEAHLDWNAEHQKVAAPADLPPSAVAVQYHTAGTPCEIYDGWVAYITKPAEGVPPDHLNRLCLVNIRGGVTLLRYVRRGYIRGRHNLLCSITGLTTAENADVAWSAPVLWQRTE